MWVGGSGGGAQAAVPPWPDAGPLVQAHGHSVPHLQVLVVDEARDRRALHDQRAAAVKC